MIPFPQQRFARLRLPEKAGSHQTVTFTAPPPGFVPDTGNTPLLARLTEADPASGALVSQRLAELAAHSDAFVTWLEQDPAHSKLFLEDPVAAIRQALPGLPADFFDGWGTL